MTDDTGPQTAEQVIRNLHNFNRKERDHLMKFALSEHPSQPAISSALWTAIAPEGFQEKQPDKEKTFVGMDYHLNWLYAALMIPDQYEKNGIDNQPNKWPTGCQAQGNKDSAPIQGNQEDVDLLVAFPGSEQSLHLVLVEAKLGSGWSSKQFQSKIRRLEAIRNASHMRLAPGLEINWRLMLASPNASPPSTNAFSSENLRDRDGWYTKIENGRTRPRYFQFGPKRLFQVKRDSASGEKWEIIRVNLAGEGGE